MWEECLCSTILCACVCVNDFPAAAAARNKNEKAKRDNEDYNKKSLEAEKQTHCKCAAPVYFTFYKLFLDFCASLMSNIYCWYFELLARIYFDWEMFSVCSWPVTPSFSSHQQFFVDFFLGLVKHISLWRRRKRRWRRMLRFLCYALRLKFSLCAQGNSFFNLFIFDSW